MAIDRLRISSKIAFIREQTTSITALIAKNSKESILSDPWLIKGIKYALQTSIEAMIDIAYHLSAQKFNHAPAEARDAIRVLADGGIISHKDLVVYGAMIGFRNRVVHGYQEVSADRVYEFARNELGDFDKYLRQVSVFLK
ncbi:MAG: hypothetical protein A4E53_04575 [Pelotomaculum sp. PtaB.Bin104]|nr:MAG: hypothetical protein A4E53_04575 [Pelotomaculum sp. PtaB.Bin104]